MASEDKKAKAAPAPKVETPAAKKDATPGKEKAADAPKAADASKTESSEPAAAAPKSYSRGEGQKPVSQAYKDNWNAIFGKKNKKKRR